VIGVVLVADFCCCSNAPMIASTESLNGPVASALEYMRSGDRVALAWVERTRTPVSFSLPNADVVLRIIGATTTNPEGSRFLIGLDDEFRCLVELARKLGYLIGARVLPAFKFFYYLSFRGHHWESKEKAQATNFPTVPWPCG
jgi:hypothetical protein